MGRTNDVTVVIPCFNYGRLLERAVTSALRNNYSAIIVDDASTDNTAEIAEHLPARYIRHEETRGVAAARNTGIREVKTPWFIPLDADDFLLPGALDQMLEVAEQADIICGDHVSPVGKRTAPMVAVINPHNLKVWNDSNLVFNSSLVRKSLWEKVRGYYEDEDHFEDQFFWFKCASVKARFVYSNTPVYCYTQGNRSKHLAENFDRLKKVQLRLYKTWVASLEENPRRAAAATPAAAAFFLPT